MYEITFVCDKCGKKSSVMFGGSATEISIPNIPIGWYQSSEGYFCDEHPFIFVEDTEITNEISE